MPKAKIAANPAHDATYPTVPLELGGRTYHLAYTIGSLSAASKALATHAAREQALAVERGDKHAPTLRVNLFTAFYAGSVDFHTLPALLYAALLPESPELEYAEVEAMVTLANAVPVYQAVSKSYVASLSPKEDADPNK